jgi:hypothetical protein
MFSSGNHEIFGADKAGPFLAYRTRVAPSMPIADAVATPFWYSYNVGRIHFLAFDIDQPYTKDSAQHKFILADLAAVDRTVTPCGRGARAASGRALTPPLPPTPSIVYAYSHFPMFCTNKFWCLDGSGHAQAFRALYEPVFNAPETRVHVFVNGHVHAAEVAFPVATGSLVPSQTHFRDIKTTFHAMVGFPGDVEVCCNDWQRPQPAMSAWRTDDVAKDGGTFGMGEFTFTSDTEATFRAWSSVNRSVLFEVPISFA